MSWSSGKKAIYFAFVITTPNLLALPSSPEVVQGEARFDLLNSNHLSIHVQDKTLINWKDFDIQYEEILQFMQPDSKAVVFNRVVGEQASEILGRLRANGSVFLINPQGVIIGKDAVINTAAFVASTLDFINPSLNGDEIHLAGDTQAQIINLGKIRTFDGDVMLIGYRVKNYGSIESEGKVTCVAASEVVIKPNARAYIKFKEDSIISSPEEGVLNAGLIEAQQVELKADGNLYALAINQEGFINARGVRKENGRVFLESSQGSLRVSGQVCIKSGITGGLLDLDAKDVSIDRKGKIDLSGKEGGGLLTTGPHVANISIEAGSHIDLSAKNEGKGGSAILSSSESFFFRGHISAKGAGRGEGGFIELSTQGGLHSKGTVEATSPFEKNGHLVLTAPNIIIEPLELDSSHSSLGSLPGLTIDNKTLNLYLDKANVVLRAHSLQKENGNLSVGIKNTHSNAIDWNSGNTLSLEADNHLKIHQGILSGGGKSDAVSLKLSGRFVSIGDESGLQENPIAIKTANGHLHCFASEVFTITGGSSPESAVRIEAQNNLHFGSKENRIGTLIAQGGNGGSVKIHSEAGDIAIFLKDDLQLRANGYNLGAPVSIETKDLASSGYLINDGKGNILIDSLKGNILLEGGDLPNCPSWIATGRGGDISIHLNGKESNIYLVGGTGLNSVTSIMTYRGGDIFADITGDYHIAPGGGEMALKGLDCIPTGIVASYRFGGNKDGSPSLFGKKGDITLKGRNLYLQASSFHGDNMINFAEVSTGHFGGGPGKIDIDLSGEAILKGGNGLSHSPNGRNKSQAAIASYWFMEDGSNDLTGVKLQANYLKMEGGNGNFSTAAVCAHSGGNVIVSIGEDIHMKGGNAKSSTPSYHRGAGIGAALFRGDGDVCVIARDIYLYGGFEEDSLDNIAFFRADGPTSKITVWALKHLYLHSFKPKLCNALFTTQNFQWMGPSRASPPTPLPIAVPRQIVKQSVSVKAETIYLDGILAYEHGQPTSFFQSFDGDINISSSRSGLANLDNMFVELQEDSGFTELSLDFSSPEAYSIASSSAPIVPHPIPEQTLFLNNTPFLSFEEFLVSNVAHEQTNSSLTDTSLMHYTSFASIGLNLDKDSPNPFFSDLSGIDTSYKALGGVNTSNGVLFGSNFTFDLKDQLSLFDSARRRYRRSWLGVGTNSLDLQISSNFTQHSLKYLTTILANEAAFKIKMMEARSPLISRVALSFLWQQLVRAKHVEEKYYFDARTFLYPSWMQYYFY